MGNQKQALFFMSLLHNCLILKQKTATICYIKKGPIHWRSIYLRVAEDGDWRYENTVNGHPL